jgi:TRAP-type uncharacterized transport system substrate-binding protein
MLKKLKNFITEISLFWKFLLILTIIPIIIIIKDTFFHPYQLSIAVGRKTGAYYEHACLYKKILHDKYQIELEIIPSIGSQDAQKKVLEGETDFAIAQSSTEIYKKDNGLFALANIAYEPIWIFYQDPNIQSFSDLKNKKNNIEKKMSGTYPVAKLLLKQIDAPLQTEHKTMYALKLLKQKKLDVIFLIMNMKATTFNRILQTDQIKILDFKEAHGYRAFFLKQSELSDYAFDKTHYFQLIQLPKYALSIKKKIPPKEITLLSTQSLLVTKDASNETVRLMLKVAQEVHKKASIFNEENHFPNHTLLKLKQHPASVEYFKEKEHRYEEYNLFNNFWLAQSFKKIETFIFYFIIPLTLIGISIEVVYPAFKRFTRREIDIWFKRINQLDSNINDLNLHELKKRKKDLEKILIEIQNRDNLTPVHLEAFYALQNQTVNILESFEKKIIQKERKNHWKY